MSNSKKAIIFDMDECIGSFWSLWPLYKAYNNDYISLDKSQDIAIKTILPGCLRPNLYYLLYFLEILKKNKKINNIFLYTNNGNYYTVKNKKENKITFPNYIITCIEKHFKLPGLFDLVMETVFIRKDDAKNNIKKKTISDLEIHGYTNINDILIFDDNKKVWITGSDRVIHVSQFRGASDYLLDKTLLKNLSNLLEKSSKNDSHFYENYLNKFINSEKDRYSTNRNDKEIMFLFYPSIIKFIF
jgi:hypothetical protein